MIKISGRRPKFYFFFGLFIFDIQYLLNFLIYKKKRIRFETGVIPSRNRDVRSKGFEEIHRNLCISCERKQHLHSVEEIEDVIYLSTNRK